jgi:hypothetical protein
MHIVRRAFSDQTLVNSLRVSKRYSKWLSVSNSVIVLGDFLKIWCDLNIHERVSAKT